MLTTAPSPTTAAAMLKPTSTVLTPRRITGAAAGRAGILGDEAAAAGRETVEPVPDGGRSVEAGAPAAGPPAVGGRGAAGAGVAPGGLTEAGTAPPGVDGPPAGRVGNLIVGAELGFGGRLMRTVSFLG